MKRNGPGNVRGIWRLSAAWISPGRPKNRSRTTSRHFAEAFLVQREIEVLHDYVAYPKGGSKAGKFMAVKDITIYAPFPQNEISQLRVVDLPGLGEAGRNLARVQTTGLSDICDITLLMKRPISGINAEWTDSDTRAMDAIADSMKFLDDKTLYTVILLNHEPGDPKDAERTEKCGEKFSVKAVNKKTIKA